MPFGDDFQVGVSIKAGTNFAAGFDCSFAGLSRLPISNSPTPGSRDEMFKRGLYSSLVSRYGWIWGHDSVFGPAQINRELQIYPDGKYAHPYGWSGLDITPEGLRMLSRPVDSTNHAEREWARIKGFALNPDGSDQPFDQGMYAKYIGEMISTYNRYAMSFGRTEMRVRVPYGAITHPSDVTQRSTIFAAGWLLEQVENGLGVDSEPVGGDGDTTFKPAKFGNAGTLTETDVFEMFSEAINVIHQTLHWHAEGIGIQSSPSLIELDFDPWGVWITCGVDMTPEKIGFYVGDKYTKVIDAPPEIRDGMREVNYNPATPWQHTNFGPGYQTHNGTDRRYMKHCAILNVARDAKLTRDFVQQVRNGGYLIPPHHDTAQMYVDYVRMSPLLTDNPDVFPVAIKGELRAANNAAWRTAA